MHRHRGLRVHRVAAAGERVHSLHRRIVLAEAGGAGQIARLVQRHLGGTEAHATAQLAEGDQGVSFGAHHAVPVLLLLHRCRRARRGGSVHVERTAERFAGRGQPGLHGRRVRLVRE